MTIAIKYKKASVFSGKEKCPMQNFHPVLEYLKDNPFRYRGGELHLMRFEEVEQAGVPSLNFAVGIQNMGGTAGLYTGTVPISYITRYEFTDPKDSDDESNPCAPASATLYFSKTVPIVKEVKQPFDASYTSGLRLHFKTNADAEYMGRLFNLAGI